MEFCKRVTPFQKAMSATVILLIVNVLTLILSTVSFSTFISIIASPRKYMIKNIDLLFEFIATIIMELILILKITSTVFMIIGLRKNKYDVLKMLLRTVAICLLVEAVIRVSVLIFKAYLHQFVRESVMFLVMNVFVIDIIILSLNLILMVIIKKYYDSVTSDQNKPPAADSKLQVNKMPRKFVILL